jgi:hypothetical protein
MAAIYCVSSGVIHFRQKRYVWAALGFASAAFILFNPIGAKTHAVKIDLPA